MKGYAASAAFESKAESIFDHEILVFDVASPRDDAPNVYIQSGLHPNETTGCGVLYSLLDRYRFGDCPANLRVIPHVNPLGWRTYIETGNGRVSNPNFINWNRIFRNEATVSTDASDRPTAEQAMADLLIRLSSGYDYVLDLHTPECGWPHVYATDLKSRLNTFDDLPHVLYGEPESLVFAEYHVLKARRTGAVIGRAITLELPSHRPQSLRDLDYWAQRLHNELESISESRTPLSTPPALAGDMIDLNSKIDGICYPVSEPGERCEAGELVATIIDPSGRRDELHVTVDTVPLCALGAAQWHAREAGRCAVSLCNPTTDHAFRHRHRIR